MRSETWLAIRWQVALDQYSQFLKLILLAGSRRYGDNWVEVLGAPRADMRSLQEVRVYVTPF